MPSSELGALLAAFSAGEGLMALAAAPEGTRTEGVPPPGVVVGWVLVADAEALGGARVDPVFLAEGKAWTPDQYRAAYGERLRVSVGRAQ